MQFDSKKWLMDIISHKQSDNIPYHYDFTPPAWLKLANFYKSKEIEEILKLPIRWNSVKTVKPLYASPETYGSQLKDEFGVIWVLSKNDRGTPMPCLSEPNLLNYNFPDPSSEYRFEDMGQWCKKNSHIFRLIIVGDLWERATFLRGMENILIDLKFNKEFVLNLLRKLTDYILETMEIIAGRFECEVFGLSDDYGWQNSLIISPEDWRKFIKPFLKEIVELAKKKNKITLLHSCGHIVPIVKDFIEIGVDILHPIQPEANNIFMLKKEYGKYITLNGGLSTQRLLSAGTPEMIKEEIKRLKNIMGNGGGYILEPGITIQGDVPLENLISMIEESQN